LGEEALMQALRSIAWQLADPFLAIAVATLRSRPLRGSPMAEAMLVATAATVRRAAVR
jgi:hypothetical protein